MANQTKQNPQIEAARIIADAIYELAEANRELAGVFQTGTMYGYKNIADIIEEMNYHQNKESREADDKAYRARMKKKEEQN